MAKLIIRFEYRSKSCERFWEPGISGRTLSLRYGTLGCHGKTRTRSFPSALQAREARGRRICEKLAVGYKPSHETSLELLRSLKTAHEPLAISSCPIGERVPEQVIYDICDWMTACIRYGMTPKQFAGVLDRLIAGTDHEFSDALGRTGTDLWIEPADISHLAALYAKAVEYHGQKFIWFDNDSCVSVVALRGDPGARSIEICVLDRKDWTESGWPSEVGLGNLVVSMTRNTARLWDGRSFAAIA